MPRSNSARDHLLREGIADKDITFVRSADFRYEGQEYQINCAMPAAGWTAAVRTSFDEAYIPPVRPRRSGARSRSSPSASWASDGSSARRWSRPARAGVDLDAAGDLRAARRWMPRSSSAAATAPTVAGPAIIEEPTATTILPPGWRAAIAAGGHMLLTRAQ